MILQNFEEKILILQKSKTMKNKLIILIFFFLISCSSANDELVEAQFVCTVDYVEFTSNSSAFVKFDVILDGISDSFIAEQTYNTQGSNFLIGDKIVNIYNFSADGNQATFDFEYGENLGSFCVDLFPNIPMHNHNPFAAEAVKDLSGKNVGRWKIKKKTNLNSIDKQ